MILTATIMRTIPGLGLLAGLAWSEPATADCKFPDSAARVVVKIGPYAGGRTGESLNQLSNFLQLLRENYYMLKQDIEPYAAAAPFLQKVELSLQDDYVITGDQITAETALKYWRDAPTTLQVFFGAIRRIQETFTIVSSIHLGDTQNPLYIMTLPLRGDEFASAKDSHTLLIYYALALQAKKLECPSDVVGHLLSRTNEIATTLLNRQISETERKRVVEIKQHVESLGKPTS